MPSGGPSTRQYGQFRVLDLILGTPLMMSHFGPFDSKRRRVGKLFLKGPQLTRACGPDQSLGSEAYWGHRGIAPWLPESSLTSQQWRLPLKPPSRGEGKFEGEGGFSGTLPPLQGKFVV